MRLAFCLFKYYPYGGLERDFLRIVKACVANGHEVHVYTLQWEGEKPENITLTFVSVSAFTNAGRAKEFAEILPSYLSSGKYDVVIGFNRMPGLDIYFAADPCFRKESLQKHGGWYQLSSRYRIYKSLEESVFSPTSKTKILLLNPSHQKAFMEYYQTPENRFIQLMPGIGEDRRRPHNQEEIRVTFREKADVLPEEKILLMVGSDFQRKGVSRALYAFAALPKHQQNETRMWIVGRDKTQKIQRLVTTLGIQDRVKFFGTRDEIPHFFAASDLLLHLAYQETAGMVLIEAIEAGLPVLVTANCGYASYIQEADAGMLVPEPFSQKILNQLLLTLLSSKDALSTYRQHALQYAKTHDLFHLAEHVIEIIEDVYKSK